MIHSLRGKKIIVNQVLLCKMWYIVQVCIIPKYIKKEIERIYDFLWNRKKNATFQAPSSTLHLEGWNRYFRHRHSIKLSNNKMDSKVIRPNQCSLKRSHSVSIELNSDLVLFKETEK